MFEALMDAFGAAMALMGGLVAWENIGRPRGPQRLQ